jgi:hypothetical protein
MIDFHELKFLGSASQIATSSSAFESPFPGLSIHMHIMLTASKSCEQICQKARVVHILTGNVFKSRRSPTIKTSEKKSLRVLSMCFTHVAVCSPVYAVSSIFKQYKET